MDQKRLRRHQCLSGISTCSINLAIGNIGLKLASKNQAIVYLSAKNMVVAFFASIGPLAGGFLADYFSTRSSSWNVELNGPGGSYVVRLLELHNLTFLFIICGLLAILALKTLRFVKEEGEVPKGLAIAKMKTGIGTAFKDKMKKEALLSLLYSPVHYNKLLQKKIKRRISNQVVNMKKWRAAHIEKSVA